MEIIIYLVGAFFLSTAVSFVSGRFLRGLLLPLSCFALYLLISSLHATGWKLEGLGLPFAFAIALMITVGVPIGLISLLGALLGSTLSNRIKTKIATKSFLPDILFAGVVAGVIAGTLWLRYEYRQNDIKNEEALALDFVKNNSTVIQKVGHGFEPSLSTASQTKDGRRVRYEFSVGTLYAIVSVSRSSGKPEFTLNCITPVVWVARDPNKDPCKQ